MPFGLKKPNSFKAEPKALSFTFPHGGVIGGIKKIEHMRHTAPMRPTKPRRIKGY